MMNRILSLLNMKQHLRALWAVMWKRTQSRFRRMVVLASIHASLAKCSEDDLEKLSEVNAEFKLAKDVKVLRFPTLMAPLIWKNLEELKGQETSDVWQLVRKIPSWLHYDNDEAIENDVRQMLQYVAASRKRDNRGLNV